MIRLFLSIAALMCAAACVQADLEKAGGICAAGGFKAGTAPYQDCVSREVAKAEQRRAEFGQAVGGAFESYGNSMQQQSYSRSPMSCTSNQYGSTVYTNCY